MLDWLLVKELSPRSFHSLVVLGHLEVGTFGVLRRFREDITLSFSSNTCSTHLRHEWLLSETQMEMHIEKLQMRYFKDEKLTHGYFSGWRPIDS